MSLKNVSVKIHDGGVVSLCDDELMGKHFEDEKHALHISEHFFRGEHLTTLDIVHALEGATSLNIVGKKSIHFAVEEGFISEKDVLFVQGVPHVQIYALN